MIVFLISGLWHGANLTFIIWGALHGLFIITENIKNAIFAKSKSDPPAKGLPAILKTLWVFLLVSLAWVFFRSPNFSTALTVLKKIFSRSLLSDFNYAIGSKPILIFSFLLIVFLLVKEYFYLVIPTKKNWVFYSLISIILISCYLFGVFNSEQFIYFQF